MKTPRSAMPGGIITLSGILAATTLTAFLAGCSGSREPAGTIGGNDDGRITSESTEAPRSVSDQRGDSRTEAGAIGGRTTGTDLASLQVPPDPAETKAAWREGVELYDAGRFADASERLDVAAAGRPDDPYGHYLLGLALWKSGELDRAEEALARSAELYPGSVRTWTNLARVRLDLNDAAGALLAADAALALDPAAADALHQQGRAFAALGRTDEALTALEAACAADPNNGYAANTLGWLELQTGRAHDAIPHLEAARNRLPNVAYVRNNLGVAYERNGEPEKAVEEYQAAVAAGDSGGKAASSLARLDTVVRRMIALQPKDVEADGTSVARVSEESEGTNGTPKK
jgi:Flp pilus assembly protein TadD